MLYWLLDKQINKFTNQCKNHYYVWYESDQVFKTATSLAIKASVTNKWFIQSQHAVLLWFSAAPHLSTWPSQAWEGSYQNEALRVLQCLVYNSWDWEGPHPGKHRVSTGCKTAWAKTAEETGTSPSSLGETSPALHTGTSTSWSCNDNFCSQCIFGCCFITIKIDDWTFNCNCKFE